MFLTKDELCDLIGRRQKRTVREWLDAERIPYIVGADGWPHVLRAVIGAKLGESIEEDEIYAMPAAPWEKDGIAPIDWMRANFSRFVVPAEEIIGRAEPYRFGGGPDKGGVYFLVEAGDIIYVGKSNSIYRRLTEHWKSGRQFEQYWWVDDIPSLFFGDVESFYINALKPTLNLHIPPLSSYMKAALKKYHSAEAA